MDIARVYLESGDAKTALSWLEKISTDETYQAHERDRLLLTIFGHLSEKQKQKDVAWRIFRRNRSKDALEALLAVIGKELRKAVVKEETQSILSNATLSLSDAAFLVQMERMEAAEHYLLERVEQLDGGFYESLLPLAEAMESGARNLAATVLLRFHLAPTKQGCG